MINNLQKYFRMALAAIIESKKKTTYRPFYRLLEILQDEDDNYTAHIQVINKNATFYIKPEELLTSNSLVDKFAPQDIRTLTYLGYLGINTPKYKILAKRLSENDEMVFVIKKSGGKNPILLKTAAEIIKEQDIIDSMSPSDAHIIGYTIATTSKLENSTTIKKY